MPRDGAYLLSDVVRVGLKQIDVACKKCGRRGRVSVARLIAEHGPDMPLPGLPQLIAKGVPAGERPVLLRSVRSALPEPRRRSQAAGSQRRVGEGARLFQVQPQPV